MCPLSFMGPAQRILLSVMGPAQWIVGASYLEGLGQAELVASYPASDYVCWALGEASHHLLASKQETHWLHLVATTPYCPQGKCPALLQPVKTGTERKVSNKTYPTLLLLSRNMCQDQSFRARLSGWWPAQAVAQGLHSKGLCNGCFFSGTLCGQAVSCHLHPIAYTHLSPTHTSPRTELPRGRLGARRLGSKGLRRQGTALGLSPLTHRAIGYHEARQHRCHTLGSTLRKQNQEPNSLFSSATTGVSPPGVPGCLPNLSCS